MIFRQITHDDLGCASYLIGDDDAGIAAVIDPKLEIDEYLRLARYFGVRIDHILETHNHADHVSGHGALAAATDASIHIHQDAGVNYPHEPFTDGWELSVGSVTVRALHTPGHRPEHTAFALTDTARGLEPWAVLSGDTLFVGGIARPDLAVDKQEGAHDIFHSLRDTLLELPDDCEVWPGHLGGSLCGSPGMDMKVASTIGYERHHQELLMIEDEDEFVARATTSLGAQPPNFENVVALNRGFLRSAISVAPAVTPGQLAQHLRGGALVVDVRTELQFDGAHIPGSVCLTALRAGFGSKLAWLADPDTPVLIVGCDDRAALAAVTLAAAVGVTSIAGYLAGGMTSWREEQRDTQETERLALIDLHSRWERDDGKLQVLDVRERSEWDAGHIPGSVHQPYHDIGGVSGGIDLKKPVAVVCGSGQRAAVAASLLQRRGAEQVIHVVQGGVPRWKHEGWPIDEPTPHSD